VYVVNANAILQRTQGGEMHRTKQRVNARGLSTWKQAPPPHSSDSRNRNGSKPTTHVLRLIWMVNIFYNQSARRGPPAEKRRQHQRSASERKKVSQVKKIFGIDEKAFMNMPSIK
jgi:hypothetical protein